MNELNGVCVDSEREREKGKSIRMCLICENIEIVQKFHSTHAICLMLLLKLASQSRCATKMRFLAQLLIFCYHNWWRRDGEKNSIKQKVDEKKINFN